RNRTRGTQAPPAAVVLGVSPGRDRPSDPRRAQHVPPGPPVVTRCGRTVRVARELGPALVLLWAAAVWRAGRIVLRALAPARCRAGHDPRGRLERDQRRQPRGELPRDR